MKKVPDYIAKTPRKRAEGVYALPRKKSYPIGDLYHARLALIFALSNTNSATRTKVVKAVAKLYPQYNWASWWNSKRKKGIPTWGQIVGKTTALAANPRRRKRASDWVLPTVSVEGSKGRWYLEVSAPKGGRTSQSKRSRRVFLKSNDNQPYIKMGKVYKTKAEAQKQRLYLLDQTELYLSMYSSYPDIYSLSQTKQINPRKRKNSSTRQNYQSRLQSQLTDALRKMKFFFHEKGMKILGKGRGGFNFVRLGSGEEMWYPTVCEIRKLAQEAQAKGEPIYPIELEMVGADPCDEDGTLIITTDLTPNGTLTSFRQELQNWMKNPRRRNTDHKLPSDVVDYGSNTRHLTKSKWIEKYIASVKAHERIIDYQQKRRRTIPPSKDFALAQLWSKMYDQFPPWGDEADKILDARPRKNTQTKPRSNPMKKALQNRIALANKYIKFAIKHGIMAEDYFGGTFPVIMTFEKPIEVSPTGRVVTVQWKDGYDMRPHKEKIYPNKFDGEEELRYTITAIIRGIKKGAKEEGWTLSHSGQSFSSKRSNTRRRVRKYALRENDAPSAKQKKARAQAKKAMNLYQSGQANTLKQAWKMVRNPRRRR